MHHKVMLSLENTHFCLRSWSWSKKSKEFEKVKKVKKVKKVNTLHLRCQNIFAQLLYAQNVQKKEVSKFITWGVKIPNLAPKTFAQPLHAQNDQKIEVSKFITWGVKVPHFALKTFAQPLYGAALEIHLVLKHSAAPQLALLAARLRGPLAAFMGLSRIKNVL